ncbi:zonadhesin [Drosophila ficusphila]|uniref:zonadhesin n=1 Tax=Drosophila ficusphila TaxID=30025 RepID=UPI0007E84F8C|nr:zonadhesin [Drosophila ficusphila]
MINIIGGDKYISTITSGIRQANKMKVTLLAVVALTTVASLVGAADPECVYRRMRNLTTHWPKPSSCSTYYRCSSKNTVRTVTCPAGKEYNPKNGRCSNAGRGLCKLSLVAPLLEATNVCSDEVNGAYLANSDKCGEFFICDEQVAYAQKCDSGSYFNETLAACIPDTDSLCWQNLCINKTDGVFVENENNCGSYYICSDSEATLQTCPSGSFFNTTVAACTVDVGNSECWVNFCIGKSDGSAVADKSDCSTFYVCSNNTATRQECPEGSYFEDNNWGCVPGDCPTEPPCDGSTTTTPAPCDEEVTTTEAPASCDCGDVKNGDFVPDESNCRKYSICVDGKLVSGDCGKGNLFNATLSVCEVDDKNQCCVADCTDGVLEVDPQDCTKYLTCTAGDWVSTSCATGSYFNTDLKACQVDEKNVCITPSSTVKTISANQCSAKDLPTSGKNCWSYTVCVDGQWEEGTCSKDYYFDDAVGICREDTRNVCPENRSTGSRKKRSADTCEGGIQQGSIIAHPTDCDKYQICEGGQLVVGLCGVGNLFQNSSGVCYPDYKATCWVCINKPNGYQMPNPTDCTSYLTCWDGVATEHSCGSDEWYDGNNECAVDVAAKCINPCGCGNGNVAHPICTKYFQCTDGVAKVVQCPAGQGFDSETGYCSSNVECSAEDCSTASDGTTYPVAGDPSKFYYCNDQVATIASCPPNSAYDASLGLCQSEPSTSCDQSVCKTAADYSTYPSLNDDSSTFCVCQDGGGYINSCPTGLFYDKDEEACTFTGNCDPRVCDDESEYSVSQDYADPNSFCLCRAGDPVSVPCPRGYTFDSEKLLCVLIPQPDPRCCKNSCVGKSDFDTVSALHTADGFCLCVDEVPKYTNCPANSQYDADLGACTPVEEETICAANECEATLCENQPDYTTYPLGCKTSGFCYCLNNCPVYHPCPGDLVYDTDLGICDTPVDPDYKPKCNDDQCDILGDNTAFAPNDGLDGFCYCDDGLATYHDCPAGEQFNEEFGICQAPDDACVTAECDVAKCAALGNGGTFPTNSATEDSNSFCYCDDDQVHLLQCGPELVYLPTEGICGVKEAPACTCEAGKCTATDDYLAYPALNTENGFCLCVAGTPVYKDCPEGESFDSDVGACLSASKMLSVYGICDSALCHSRAVLATTYPAKNTTNGYCSCQEVGVSSFTSCAAGHVYEQIMGTCVVEACDYTVCLERSAPEAFEARNTTDGFCSCNGVPIFHHCPRGQAYDKVEKLCAIKDAIAMISCSLKECKRRSQFEPFAAENTKSGFCSCDDQDLISVTYHPCPAGEVFDPELGVCSFHSIQKRSLEAEENICDPDEMRSVPANCSQYEVCIDGHWRRRTCSDQRYYNPEQQRCLEPRDDLVCAYARVSNLPICNDSSESQTVATKSGNCWQYFRCSGGKWRLRSCPRQHYYSSGIESCIPVPRGHEKDQNQTVCNWARAKSAVIQDCQHLEVRPSLAGGCLSYLMCLDNSWWLHQCPLGMYFSTEHNYCLPNDAGQCSLPEELINSNCSDGESRSLVGSCHSYEFCSEGQWIRRRCQEKEQFKPLMGCVPSDRSCQDNGMRRVCREGEFRAQFNNCSQTFLYCESEEWHLGSCLRGHGFDSDLNKCQLQSKCQPKVKDFGTENQCLGQLDGLSVPDPSDCTRFYLCIQQMPALLQSCQSGSFFDSKEGYCRPNDGSCQLAICSGLEDGKLVAHPEDCRSYYSCSTQNGTTLVQCEEGQYFHSLLSMCRVDHGQCRKVSDQEDTGNSTSLCSGLHGVKVPHETYCNLYYACVKGLAIPIECPVQHQFNPVLSTCEPESQAVEKCLNGQLEGNSSYVYSCGNLQDGSFLANRTDCTRYFICAGGVATAQKCAAGTFFDPEKLLCVVDDGSCPLVETTPDDDDNPNNQHVPPDPLVCEGKHGYIMPDPANCNNFYICVSGKLRHELCYTDYFFNSTLQQCQAYEVNSDSGYPTEKPVETQQMEIGGQEKAATSGICRDAATSFADICGIIGNGASVAEQGDCRRYTSCDNDEPTSQRCRNGESFDSLLGICRQSDGTCLMENGERLGVCNGKHGQLIRDADNCRGYFTCVHGQQIGGECEQGEFFNRLTNSCELDVLQQCKSDTEDVIRGDNLR